MGSRTPKYPYRKIETPEEAEKITVHEWECVLSVADRSNKAALHLNASILKAFEGYYARTSDGVIGRLFFVDPKALYVVISSKSGVHGFPLGQCLDIFLPRKT